MATTALDILTSAALRLGENGHPDDVNEGKRRLDALSRSHRDVLRKRFWWFTETIYPFSTTANKAIYTLPTDYRDSIELRINGTKVDFVPNHVVNASEEDPKASYLSAGLNGGYYIFNNKLYLLPEASETPATLSVSSIVVSGTTATITTTTDHGLLIDQYVTLSGASVTLFNTSHLVTTVPTSTTFTIEVASGTTNPTGTITAQYNNAVLKYFNTPAKITAIGDTITVPDLFIDCLSAYVFAWVKQRKSQRGDAGDGYTEYNDIVKELEAEDEKRNVWGKAIS